MNQKQEDYLITMFRLQESQGQIRSVGIAEELKISKASVSEMLKKLKTKKLIKMDLYSNVEFTKKGLNQAGKLTRKHRLIESFLKEVLGFSEKRVHEEAHDLEHAFSDYGIKKLDNFLRNKN